MPHPLLLLFIPPVSFVYYYRCIVCTERTCDAVPLGCSRRLPRALPLLCLIGKRISLMDAVSFLFSYIFAPVFYREREREAIHIWHTEISMKKKRRDLCDGQKKRSQSLSHQMTTTTTNIACTPSVYIIYSGNLNR